MKQLIHSIYFGILFSGSVYSQVPSYVPLSGLQGFWTFSGNANDVSGNGNNGTLNGPTATTDRFNSVSSAFYFNGSGDYISTNYAGVLGTNPRAVSFWAKSSQANLIMSGVAWGSIGTASRYEAGFNYGASGPMLDGGNGVITFSANTPSSDNKWHHYVVQFGFSNQLNMTQIYQDAQLLANVANVYNPTNLLNTISDFNVMFGKIDGSVPHYFNGALDDIGIWNRRLTLCEIQKLYTSSNSVECLGLTDNARANFKLSPNPSLSFISIKGLMPDCEILISDLNGRQLAHYFANEENFTIDLKDFDLGVLIVSIQSAQTELYRQKIIHFPN